MLSSMNETITVTTTKQSLYTILAAIDANTPRNVCKVEIRGDPAQSANVFIGGPALADNKYSFLIATDGDIYSDDAENMNAIALNQIFLKVVTAGASQTIHARVRVF